MDAACQHVICCQVSLLNSQVRHKIKCRRGAAKRAVPCTELLTPDLLRHGRVRCSTMSVGVREMQLAGWQAAVFCCSSPEKGRGNGVFCVWIGVCFVGRRTLRRYTLLATFPSIPLPGHVFRPVKPSAFGHGSKAGGAYCRKYLLSIESGELMVQRI